MEKKTRQFLEALSQEQILGTVPSGLFLVDDKKRIVYWNREAERITGYQAAETIGRHCSFLEGIECGNICGLYDAGAPEKPIIGAECRIRTKAGDEVVISKNVDFLCNDGEIIGGIESFVDITAQKKQEEKLRQHGKNLVKTVAERTAALRDERNRLRSVLDGMSDLAYIVTSDYRIAFINTAMENLLGPSRDKVCYEVIQNTHAPCEGCPWGLIAAGSSLNEERQFGQNGRYYEIVHTPLNTPRGELQKLAVCRDVTERKEAAEKLLELNKQLDAFARTVSHDLKSPLTGVLGFAELLRQEHGDVLEVKGLSLLQEIEGQGGRMLELIDDLLTFSTAGSLPVPKEPANTNEIVKQVLLDNQFEIMHKEIKVITKELPKLMVQDSQLYEVLSNVLVNAVRYGCSQGGRVEIHGEARDQGHCLVVSDHGPGIPVQEYDSVFDVFYRGTTSGDIQGTGVGLATVKKIMQSCNGSVQLEETSGGGCSVKMYFPER